MLANVVYSNDKYKYLKRRRTPTHRMLVAVKSFNLPALKVDDFACKIIRPRRSFPRTICRSVRASVRRSVPCIVEKGGSDPDAVWHHRSDGSRDEAGSEV